eukprot:TRINITY_DN4698_c0_g1_i2.p1 TRINITY_DN4698_c0_g1~~TRINITY_DN4698_c0_g1_i2.p1  ORF type:complete len:286 (+),score=103.06 TRINITY_DN4698_c0_g1_i2:91-858(+)
MADCSGFDRDAAEIELLEKLLEEQALRTQAREAALQQYDEDRLAFEKEKQRARRAEREDRERREREDALKLIAEEEEKQYQREMAAEREKAEKELENLLAGLTEEQRNDMLSDLAELERLEASLERTEDSLEHRRSQVQAIIEQQDAAEAQRQQERGVVEDQESSSRLRVVQVEQSGWMSLCADYESERLQVEELRVAVREQQMRIELQRRRDAQREGLSEEDRKELSSLSEEKQHEVLDDLVELAALKARLRKY